MDLITAKEQLPYVTVKYAQSLDGRIATRTGESQWISGDASLVYAHELRASHDAILVGIGTVIRDNPRLTVRHTQGHNPLRVIVDSRLRIPLSAAVLSDEWPKNTLVATTDQSAATRANEIRRTGASIFETEPDENGRVDLPHLLFHLEAMGLHSLMVEGGAGIITSLLKQGLVDRLVICIAPIILGSGVEAVGDLDIQSLSRAINFASAKFRRQGDDMLFEGIIRREPRSLVAPVPSLGGAE